MSSPFSISLFFLILTCSLNVSAQVKASLSAEERTKLMNLSTTVYLPAMGPWRHLTNVPAILILAGILQKNGTPPSINRCLNFMRM